VINVMRQGFRPDVDRIVVDGNDELVTRLRMRKMRQPRDQRLFFEMRGFRNQGRARWDRETWTTVIAGLDPAIRPCGTKMDAPIKSGHDVNGVGAIQSE
jgi:hypothetical protein